MNIKMLNTINLDDVIIKKGGSGGNAGGGGESGGGSNTQENDVTFYDYDGTILHSYTKKDFLALTEFPELPVQKGLICEGWNNNIDEALSYVREYGFLLVGATYVTDDGKTRLYISTAIRRMLVPLSFKLDTANRIIIDWGDGSDKLTFSNTGNITTNHTYSKVGNYVITLESSDGGIFYINKSSSSTNLFNESSNGSLVYSNILKKVEFGNSVSINKHAFAYCNSLQSVTVNKSFKNFALYAFINCRNLYNIVIPYNSTLGQNVFLSCGIQNVIMPSRVNFSYDSSQFMSCGMRNLVLPSNVSSIPKLLCLSSSVLRVILPKSVTSIGDKAFYGCSRLTSITIPDSVTSIGSDAFKNCFYLKSVILPINNVSIESGVFYSCSNLESIIIPSNVINIGSSMFYNCENLLNVTIQNGVTGIKSYAFYLCKSLCNITIPNSVTSIENSAFYSSGLRLIDFSQHESIPTLGSDVFTGVYNYNIIVPDALYDEWIAATNWSNYAKYIIKKSDYDAL